MTDGSPTNGAFGLRQIRTGGGKWKQVCPAIYVKKANTQAITNAVPTLLTWPTTIAQIGGTWDGTEWTPGVVGTVRSWHHYNGTRQPAPGGWFQFLR